MIIIIHGQDEVASRKYLFELIKNTKGETVRAGKSDLEGDNLSKALSDISLFAQERTIIIENFLKIKSLVLKENAKNLFNNFSGTIIFWEDGQRPATLLSSFGKAKILEFKIQSSVFRFLDAIKPNQGQGNVSLFKQALIRSSPEIIFALLARRFIDLISPSEKAADWQKNRLKSQAKLFTAQSLKKAIKDLVSIDLSQKTSKSPLSLNHQLEIFLLQL